MSEENYQTMLELVDDVAPPPSKRMKLHTPQKSDSSFSEGFAYSEVDKDDIPRTRKRKIPSNKQRRSLNITDLDAHALFELFRYLSIEGTCFFKKLTLVDYFKMSFLFISLDLCNMAEISHHMCQIARTSFYWKCRNGIELPTTGYSGRPDFNLLTRVLRHFGDLLSSISIRSGSAPHWQRQLDTCICIFFIARANACLKRTTEAVSEIRKDLISKLNYV